VGSAEHTLETAGMQEGTRCWMV